MEIGIRYKIESNAKNVILYEKVKCKRLSTGETYEDWREIGYYATVESALNGLIDQKVRDSELKDLEVVLKEISDLREMVETALKSSVVRKKAVKI